MHVIMELSWNLLVFFNFIIFFIRSDEQTKMEEAQIELVYITDRIICKYSETRLLPQQCKLLQCVIRLPFSFPPFAL